MVDVPRDDALDAAPAIATVAPMPAALEVDWAAEDTSVHARRHVNLWKDAWRRLQRNKLAMFGLGGIIFLLFLTFFADWLMPYDYDYQHFGNIGEPPSLEFPLGTDLVGRDMLSRMIYGARVSMSVALISQFAVLLIAVPIGAAAGYYGGWVDT